MAKLMKTLNYPMIEFLNINNRLFLYSCELFLPSFKFSRVMTSNSFQKILPPIIIQPAAKENKNNHLQEITIRVIEALSLVTKATWS